MKVKNISAGPRGLNTKSGQVILAPGEVRDDIELEAAEQKIAEGSEWFEFGAKAKADEPKADERKPSEPARR